MIDIVICISLFHVAHSIFHGARPKCRAILLLAQSFEITTCKYEQCVTKGSPNGTGYVLPVEFRWFHRNALKIFQTTRLSRSWDCRCGGGPRLLRLSRISIITNLIFTAILLYGIFNTTCKFAHIFIMTMTCVFVYHRGLIKMTNHMSVVIQLIPAGYLQYGSGCIILLHNRPSWLQVIALDTSCNYFAIKIKVLCEPPCVLCSICFDILLIGFNRFHLIYMYVYK